MNGVVVKIHSNFYYVRSEKLLFECKIREKLKKQKQDVFVGDKVLIEEVDLESMQAAISSVFERKNVLQKPSIANIDKVITVASIIDPELDYSQLDRFLVNAKMHGFDVVICINKVDLMGNDEEKKHILSIYEQLGYKVIFLSAKTGEGIDEFRRQVKGVVSILSGESGVGKSSILNRLSPDLNLKTKEISLKNHRGTHTTRHIELVEINIDNELAKLADAPGFSYLKFDNILPDEIDNYFEEIKDLSENCFYNNCLHLNETGCNVIANLDKVFPSRYESYKAFVNEAFEYKKKLTYSSHKAEKKSKTIDKGNNEKIKIIKLGIQQREDSRRKSKQKLKNVISSLDDAYYNDENLD